MTVDTIITNGTLVSRNQKIEADLLIDDGTIVGIRDSDTPNTGAETVIDAQNNYVLPGVVDGHVHIDRDPWSKESWTDASLAAAAGGVTTMIAMAFQNWEESNSLVDEIKEQRSRAEEQVLVDFGLHGALVEQDLAVFDEIQTAIDMGVPSFKMFMSTYDAGVPIGFIDRAFAELSDHDATAICHTEQPSICRYRREQAMENWDGDATEIPDARPPFTEGAAADTALRMAEYHDVQYFGYHTTSIDAAEEISEYQDDGSQIRAETCIEYITFDKTAYEDTGNIPTGPPPLRDREHVEALYSYLSDGTLNTVSTDHVGQPKRHKNQGQPWWSADEGTNHMQYLLSALYTELCEKRDYPITEVVRLLCDNPARTFGLPSKGRLRIGADADVIVFDSATTHSPDSDENAGVADYTVYDDRVLHGTVTLTMVRGNVVCHDGGRVTEPVGTYQPRDVTDWNPLR